MLRWLLILGLMVLPASGIAATSLPTGFATERFAPVKLIGALPPPVRRAVDRYIRFEWLGDFGAVSKPGGGCVRIERRVLVAAGLGRTLDFVVYQHFNHDHLLVYRHGPHGERVLAFSCSSEPPRGLPRSSALLTKAVLKGDCHEETAVIEGQ